MLSILQPNSRRRWARFGCSVTIVQRATRLIPREEPAIASILAETFHEEGIDLLLDAQAIGIESVGYGIRLSLQDRAAVTAERGVGSGKKGATEQLGNRKPRNPSERRGIPRRR